MIAIPNQPIDFSVTDIDTPYLYESTLLYNQSDTIQFQIKGDEQADSLSGSGDFDVTYGTLTAGASYDASNDLIAFANAGTWSDSIAEIASKTYWRVRADVDIVSGTMEVRIGGELIKSYTSSISMDEYFLIDTAVGTTIQFATTASGASATIDNVIVNQIEYDSLLIKDCDAVTQYTFPTGTYSALTRYFTLTDTGNCIYYFYNEFIKIEVMPTGLSLADGQYYFNLGSLDSNAFSLGTHSETSAITWRGETDTDQLGFSYNATGFIQTLRAEVEVNNPRWQKDKVSYKYSDGSKTLPYSSVDRVVTLKTELLDASAHAALALALEHDYFFIDGVKYINKDTEYSPEWGEFHKARVSVELERDELLVNRN